MVSASSSSSSSKGNSPREETPAAAAPVVPISIGKIAVHGDSSTWRPENTHSSFEGVFGACENQGANDWAYGHNRLLYPGSSSIKANFRPPVGGAREAYPDCKFIMRTAYFGPWNMDPCTINLKVNGENVLKNAQVLGEHQGRTTHDTVLNDLPEGDCTCEIEFNEGHGVLFLWYFELLVKPC